MIFVCFFCFVFLDSRSVGKNSSSEQARDPEYPAYDLLPYLLLLAFPLHDSSIFSPPVRQNFTAGGGEPFLSC